MKISASFLSCYKIIPAVKELSLTDVDYIHVDFVDGRFVTGKKIPFRKLKKIRKLTSKRLDIHLMTNQLTKYIKKFATLNCEYITFHVEVTDHIEKYIDMIHNYGIKCGLAINPDTSIDKIKPYLSMVDMVLVMGVVPGYGGQKFIPKTVNKVKKLKEYIVDHKFKTFVSIDGGINDQTLKKINEYVDVIVVGSYITNSDHFQEQITKLRKKK